MKTEKKSKLLLEKKEAYEKPSIQVYDIETEEIIANSNDFVNESFYEDTDDDW